MIFMKDTIPHPLTAALPEIGFVRLPAILAPLGPIPVSRSTWWAGIRLGRYPRPVKLGPRISAWRVEDIRALIENPERALIELKAAVR
jgi:prophage regulatory protein